MEKLILESQVLVEMADEYETINQVKIPVEFVKNLIKQQVNLNVILSFQEGARDFSQEEYLNLLLDMNFLGNINLNKAILYLKNRFQQDKIGVQEIDELLQKVENEDTLFLSLCKYDYAEDLVYFPSADQKLGFMVSILYNSQKCIEYFQNKNIERFRQINNNNIWNIIRNYPDNKSLYGPIKYWDVSRVTDMSGLFENFDGEIPDISRWNTSNVTDMYRMFYRCETFNSDISKWNTSNVTNMCEMFKYCYIFNSDISRWNVSNVRNMSHMFFLAGKFNSDLSHWDVSNVQFMFGVFENAVKFNSDISRWNVSNVTNMVHMFYCAESFNSDLSNWNVSNVTSMVGMFYHAEKFNSDLSNWNVSNVTNMSHMFRYAKSFNSDLSRWNVSNVTDMSWMFTDTENFNSDLSRWNVSNVTNKTAMFADAKSFGKNPPKWNLGKKSSIPKTVKTSNSGAPKRDLNSLRKLLDKK